MSDRRVSDILNVKDETGTPSPSSDKLTSGLLSSCEADLLTQVAKELSELTSQQDVLLGQVESHNQLLKDCPQLDELKHLMEHFKVGLDKLSLVRSEISSTHERCSKLKERAARVQMEAIQRGSEEEIPIANLALEEDNKGREVGGGGGGGGTGESAGARGESA